MVLLFFMTGGQEFTLFLGHLPFWRFRTVSLSCEEVAPVGELLTIFEHFINVTHDDGSGAPAIRTFYENR